MISKLQISKPEAIELAERAEEYLNGMPWCRQVTDTHLAWAVSPIIGVFLLDIFSTREDFGDSWWVIVGDLPPACLPADRAADWQEALQMYCSGMQMWVNAVFSGESVEKLIPVNVPPTHEYADLLQRRIDFIETRFLNEAPENLPCDE